MALEANATARALCEGDPEGLKDLDQQQQKFIAEMAPVKGTSPLWCHQHSVRTPRCPLRKK